MSEEHAVSRAALRVGCILMMGVLLLALSACGGQTEQPASTATPDTRTGAVQAMAPVKTATLTAEPTSTNAPRPTNTRVLPQTPMATADPNRPSSADVARIDVAEAKAKVPVEVEA